MALTVEIVTILFASVLLLYFYFKWNRQYWSRRNVPCIETNSIWGHIENPLTMKHPVDIAIKQAHDEYKKQGHKHGGIFLFMRPCYIPVEVELIKQIMTKDFSHFTGRGLPMNEKEEPLSAHLFNLDGNAWRDMRVLLTPTFTSGKMKIMFNTLLECGKPMMHHIEELCEAGTPLDIKEILACYTTDVIGSCAFGLECNSFEDPDSEFRKHGKEIFKPPLLTGTLQMISFIIPAIEKLFHVRSVSKQCETFFINVIRDIIGYRKTNNVKRNDFMQLFSEINEKATANGQETLTINQIAAQSFVFFLAGFETSSTTMAFCLHELAFNQGIQDKLRNEIRETMKKYDGKITYDGIMEMEYMDKVVNETLRKYPPVATLDRVCSKDYAVPNTDVVVEKGIKIFISTLGLHRDEEYYPDPNTFDPERFSKENKTKRPAFAFLPFGEGPRNCIGLRFGLMQTKTGLSMLLNSFRILPAKGETHDFDFDPDSIVLSKKGNIVLIAVKLDSL